MWTRMGSNSDFVRIVMTAEAVNKVGNFLIAKITGGSLSVSLVQNRTWSQRKTSQCFGGRGRSRGRGGGGVRGCFSLRSVKSVPSSSGYNNKPKVLVSSEGFHALLTTNICVNTMATRLRREMWTNEMNRTSFAVSDMNMAFYEICKSCTPSCYWSHTFDMETLLIKIWITFETSSLCKLR
jgi:hypothetical protein